MIFNKEILEPIIIDIGNKENNIIGVLFFKFSIFYLKFVHTILFDLCTVSSFLLTTDKFSNIL